MRGVAAAIALILAMPAHAQEDFSALQQAQLDAMKERLAKLEAERVERRRVSIAVADTGVKPQGWRLRINHNVAACFPYPKPRERGLGWWHAGVHETRSPAFPTLTLP